ncbi:MAG: hypothetical protein ABSF29_14420 [Tepidisphaeraceae bacterium]|jgi:hypothetical protein
MKRFAWIAGLMAVLAVWTNGCATPPKPYGREQQLFLPGMHSLVWAVAPTVNLSGQAHVDPLLQSDLVFQELQAVRGLTVIPVDRVVEVYASLRIEKVESEAQATNVCDLLGCDGLVVPTVTAYDPYDPPKMGASLQLFAKPGTVQQIVLIDPHELDRSPTVGAMDLPRPQRLVQAVGIFDASSGSVRQSADAYAAGRTDPNGPMGSREVYLDMSRYGGFVYHELIGELLDHLTVDGTPQ